MRKTIATLALTVAAILGSTGTAAADTPTVANGSVPFAVAIDNGVVHVAMRNDARWAIRVEGQRVTFPTGGVARVRIPRNIEPGDRFTVRVKRAGVRVFELEAVAGKITSRVTYPPMTHTPAPVAP